MRTSVSTVLISIGIAAVVASCSPSESELPNPNDGENGGTGGGGGQSCGINQTACGGTCCNNDTHECAENECVIPGTCKIGTICDTGKVCNANRKCVDGCAIDGSPQLPGRQNPDNPCERCDPERPTEWTSVLAGTPCRNNGVCDASAKCVISPTIAAGAFHTCGVTSAGKVFCWGSNSSGQLGYETEGEESMPAPVPALSSGVVAVSAGGAHTCALTDSGAVLCWGANSSGQLGNGSDDDRGVPTPVLGLQSGVIAISAGRSHSCAVMNNGKVMCWGNNMFGQLGDGSLVDRDRPTPVVWLSGKAVSVSAGGLYTCAVMESGIDMCWGQGDWGQLGNGDVADQPTPVEVNNSENIIKVSAGLKHTCDLSATGTLRCWGDNVYGQLGNGSFLTPQNPAPVTGLMSDTVDVASGDNFTCALRSTGTLLCWGVNFRGELGDGTNNIRDNPAPVESLGSSVKSLAQITHRHTCVITKTDEAKCWGDNSDGQLGVEYWEGRLGIPATVIGFP
ncbi:MAG: hypothetical protein FWD57_00455 [Polyangiaceae bacterium]|nr:hypothetical protein [Polyangiaceae bacterium]